ncbi:MAG: hypothetical protein WBB67_11825 [bacterium]
MYSAPGFENLVINIFTIIVIFIYMLLILTNISTLLFQLKNITNALNSNSLTSHPNQDNILCSYPFFLTWQLLLWIKNIILWINNFVLLSISTIVFKNAITFLDNNSNVEWTIDGFLASFSIGYCPIIGFGISSLIFVCVLGHIKLFDNWVSKTVALQ